MRARGSVLGAVALAAALAAPGARVPASLGTPGAPAERGEADRVAAHPIAFFDRRTFALAVTRSSVAPATPRPGIRGLVVPHHWFAADLIVEALRDTAVSAEVRRIVLVGPNHIGAGHAPFITSGRPWLTPTGTVNADVQEVDRLARAGALHAAPRLLRNEHSISGLVPALGHFFPGATLIPIAVRARTDPETVRHLATELSGLLADPSTLIIASVDFSHYRSAAEAARRNLESIAAMTALDSGAVLAFGNEHMDSPGSISLLIESMRRVGASRFEVWRDATSADFGGPSVAPHVTSYLTGAYR